MIKDLKLALFLGYKSIINGHKSTIALMIFILSLAFVNLVFVASILNGITTTINNQIINNLVANIVISPQEEPTREKYIIDTKELRQQIENLPGVTATALINNPKILFADEPMANLDTNSSRQILELFQKLNQELGQTIVMVTHEPDDQKYVDRVIWIKDGLIEREEKG